MPIHAIAGDEFRAIEALSKDLALVVRVSVLNASPDIS
jgi:hypothetical protein